MLSLANLHERDVNPAIRDLYSAIIKARRQHTQGSSSRAIDTLTEAIESFERGSIPIELGYAYYTRATFLTVEDKLEEALDDFTLALELQPNMQDYFLARGIIYAETELARLAGVDFHNAHDAAGARGA